MRNPKKIPQSIKEAFEELDKAIAERKGRHEPLKHEKDGREIKEIFRKTRKGVLQ